MGWFWGAATSEKPLNTSKDPLRDLDPGLRDFLSKESPVKYSSSNPPSTQVPPSPAEEATPKPSDAATVAKPRADAPTLFKDGRYAHLWSTYQPQAEIESVAKSDAEKIDDVLQGYKQRQAEIGRAALENCALEQWDVNECFRNGGVVSRLSLCRAENRKFERCYLMQAKFLKALGYLSTYERPPEIDEQIQMHADTLYHRMLDQEAAIEAATAEGKPIPTFPPLVTNQSLALKSKAAKQEMNKEGHADLPPSVRQELEKRLEGKTGEDRDLEERAVLAEMQTGVQLAGQLKKVYDEQEAQRKLRKEQGKETLADKVTVLFGFGSSR